jgi:hypothetical protein
MWMLVFGHHEDRTPTHGYEPTREGAMAAFAKELPARVMAASKKAPLQAGLRVGDPTVSACQLGAALAACAQVVDFEILCRQEFCRVGYLLDAIAIVRTCRICRIAPSPLQ